MKWVGACGMLGVWVWLVWWACPSCVGLRACSVVLNGGWLTSCVPRVAEWPHAGGASVGRVRAPPGGRAAGAQVRRGLRDLLAQREVRGERGLPARHDGQRVELEGEAALLPLGP